jgi:hypothetical protein
MGQLPRRRLVQGVIRDDVDADWLAERSAGPHLSVSLGPPQSGVLRIDSPIGRVVALPAYWGTREWRRLVEPPERSRIKMYAWMKRYQF